MARWYLLDEGPDRSAGVRGEGGEVWYLVFADEGHGFAKRRNADYFQGASMLFWQKHLLGE